MTLSPSFLSSYRYGDPGYDFSFRFSELRVEDKYPFPFIVAGVYYILGSNIMESSSSGAEGVVSQHVSMYPLTPEGLLQTLYAMLISGFFRRLGLPDDVTSRLLPRLFDFARNVEDNNRPTQILLYLYVSTLEREGETTEEARARLITEDTFFGECQHPISFDSEAKNPTEDWEWFRQYDLDVEHCAICLQGETPGEKSTGTRLACSHMYHAPCLLRWMVKNQTCPLCRAPFYPRWFGWLHGSRQGCGRS